MIIPKPCVRFVHYHVSTRREFAPCEFLSQKTQSEHVERENHVVPLAAAPLPKRVKKGEGKSQRNEVLWPLCRNTCVTKGLARGGNRDK